MSPGSLDDDRQQSVWCSSQMQPDAACQGRQARSPGSDVTTTAHNEIFDAKIRSKSDVVLEHVKGERPAKKHTAKIRNRRPRRTSTGDDGRDVLSVFRTRYSAHLQEIVITTVVKTSVPDVRLSIPAVSCVVTSANAGKPRSIFIK